MYKFAFCMLLPLALNAQKLVSSFSIDTAQHRNIQTFTFRGPEKLSYSNSSVLGLTTEFLSVYRLKNTDKCDIFSFSGKIATITVPDKINFLQISQFFIDDDAGWEYIGRWLNKDNNRTQNTVFDENGNELLSDSGDAFYGYDGQNTYVCYWTEDKSVTRYYKVWQFRTNVASSAPQNLSKLSGSQLQRPIVTYGLSGDYRVSLKPTAGGKTTVQIYDLLGRLTFSKVISDITKPTTFSIQAGNVPQSPFITRATDVNGQTTQSSIPVR